MSTWRFLFGLCPHGQLGSHLALTQTLRGLSGVSGGGEGRRSPGVVPVLELRPALWGFLEKGSAGLGPNGAFKKPIGSRWKDWAFLFRLIFPDSCSGLSSVAPGRMPASLARMQDAGSWGDECEKWSLLRFHLQARPEGHRQALCMIVEQGKRKTNEWDC